MRIMKVLGTVIGGIFAVIGLIVAIYDVAFWITTQKDGINDIRIDHQEYARKVDTFGEAIDNLTIDVKVLQKLREEKRGKQCKN